AAARGAAAAARAGRDRRPAREPACLGRPPLAPARRRSRAREGLRPLPAPRALEPLPHGPARPELRRARSCAQRPELGRLRMGWEDMALERASSRRGLRSRAHRLGLGGALVGLTL